VKKAIFQMEHNKALGPDGFPAEFCQKFWDIIKTDLMELFGELHSGQLELFRIILGKLFYCQRLMRPNGFNNLDQSAFLTVLIFYKGINY
jgi:hypothetical protein